MNSQQGGLFAFSREESIQLINVHGLTHALTLRDSHAWARQRTRPVRALFRILCLRPQKEAERIHGFGREELRKTPPPVRTRRAMESGLGLCEDHTRPGGDFPCGVRPHIRHVQVAAQVEFQLTRILSEQVDESQDFGAKASISSCMNGATLDAGTRPVAGSRRSSSTVLYWSPRIFRSIPGVFSAFPS